MNTVKYHYFEKILLFFGSTVLGILLLFFLYTHEYHLVLDIVVSLAALAFVMIYKRELKQDAISIFFLVTALILHNLHLYGSTPLGIPFDHYMHFYAGFTLAIIADRLFFEKMHTLKHNFLIIFVALGVGSVGEIIEWLGYGILGSGKGFFFFGMGDEGEWRNAALDMIFNMSGAVLAAIVCFLSRKK